MSNPRDVRIREAKAFFTPVPFRMPLKFGGRVVDTTDLMNVRLTVETAVGQTATGYGSMPVGNVWAWPTKTLEPSRTAELMKQMLTTATDRLASSGLSGHPIEIIHDFLPETERIADEIMTASGTAEPMEPLARLVALSPLDAALHDAYGRGHEQNSYNTLGSDFLNRDLAHFLGPRFAGEYLDRYTRRDPEPTMPLYHLVGALDPLTDDDIEERVNDGLPETLPDWIRADGLTHLKIKLSGDDLDWDVARVLRIDSVTEAVQDRRGVRSWWYSLDFNEKCESVEYVLEFLHRLREGSPAGFDRVQYIEQPTHRNLAAHPENRMHRAAELKPVVIDESLLNLESLHMAVDLGYTGVALKACKGQTESLLLGAAAQKDDLFLCVQDLTCPGFSFLHSASLASRVRTVTAIEGNGRQYCPAPNDAYADSYPGMFEITDGTVRTSELDGPGLGFGFAE